MTFGEKIKEARLAMNLSQTELAQMTGISERSLYMWFSVKMAVTVVPFPGSDSMG